MTTFFAVPPEQAIATSLLAWVFSYLPTVAVGRRVYDLSRAVPEGSQGSNSGIKSMKCPFCGHLHDKVVDSRESKEGDAIRRRRQCLDASAGSRATNASTKSRTWSSRRTAAASDSTGRKFWRAAESMREAAGLDGPARNHRGQSRDHGSGIERTRGLDNERLAK